MLRRISFLVSAAAMVTMLATGCGTPVQNPVTGHSERTVLSEADEVSEGARAHQEILSSYGVVQNPALQAYVNGVGQKLAAASHRAQLKWTFTVLDSPEVNAFALPGGYVYITRGMLAYLDSEADLAGVLGHEIGHVTARHGAQRATRQQQAGLGVLLGTIGGVLLESAGMQGAAQAASQVSQTVAAGSVSRYSREQELQADQLGAEYLSRTRYNPQNMVDVIQVLRDQERYAAEAARAAGRPAPQQGNSWLASHPTSDQRLAQIRQRASELASTPGASWSADGRERYLRAIDGMTFGDSREQGVVRGRQFFHEPMNIALTAPSGWRIINDAEQVAVLAPSGDAALIMQLVPAQAGQDHEQILRQRLGAVDGRVERTSINGMNATRFSGTRRNAQGQTGPLEVTLVTGPGGRVFLLGHAARDAATLARVRPALLSAEASFRPLNAADRAAAQPWRLEVVPLPPGGFAELARSSPLTELPEQQLRLLNGAYAGSGGLRIGQPVKIVE